MLRWLQVLVNNWKWLLAIPLRVPVHVWLRSDIPAYYTALGDDLLAGFNDNFRDTNKPLWLNLGYWKDAKTYAEASAALASYLADSAQLSSDEEVLDVGCGFGEQDLLWIRKYDVGRIVGLNITQLQVDVAKRRVRERKLEHRIDFCLGSATNIPFPENRFDKVMALECAFHFDTRDKFFSEAFRVLRPGGRLAIADVLPLAGQYRSNSWISWIGRRYVGLPKENMYDSEAYCKKLGANNFVNITKISIRNHVYPGMAKYVRLRHAGKRMEDAAIELTEEEIATCKGVEIWEKTLGIADYVIFTAEKFSSGQR